jgi:hypothetical protein
MFVGSLVAAIAATVWLVSLFVLEIQTPPPAPPSVATGTGAPPPPAVASSLTGLIIIATATFAIAWIATIMAAIRDQILSETNRILSEYGEMRETDGFLNGLRQASRPEVEVRALHPVPPMD